MVFEIKGVDELIKDFSQFAAVSDTAMIYAMNQRARKAQTKASKDVRSVWKGIGAGQMKAYVYTIMARKGNVSTEYVLTSSPIPLSEFGAKWTPKQKGVSYLLKNKRRTMSGSFMGKGRGGKQQVWIRTSKEDKKLVRKVSITPTSMFTGMKADELYVKEYFGENGADFNKVYLQKLDYLFKKK